MPAPHIFALPNAQADDYLLPISPAGPPRKRKRQFDSEDGADENSVTLADDAVEPDDESATDVPPSLAYTTLTANELGQRQTAGLKPGIPIPLYPFPHSGSLQRGYVLSHARKELKDLDPPIAHLDPSYHQPLPFKTNEDRTVLREQHSAILTTLLHQMLQKGDYARAGRAWSLLLRSGYVSRDTKSRTGLKSMDVRTHDRWGIGAELLLRRRPEDEDQTANISYHSDFSDEGFLMARQYYDRLVIQYPIHHNRKGAQASTFYTAMFSLWIYEITQRHKATPDASAEGHSSPASSASSSSPDPDPTNVTFQDIKAITAKMDDVLATPPYDVNAELLQMRGMVALWAADLFDHQTSKDAVRFFEKAEDNGAHLPQHAKELVELHGRDAMSYCTTEDIHGYDSNAPSR